MKKIPTIFLRDMKLKCTPVTDETNPECQWVFDGEGIATRKIDGINVKLQEGEPFVRIKPVGDYTEAEYLPLARFVDKYVAKAVEDLDMRQDGIYEAYGEGIRGNPERAEGQHIVRLAYLYGPSGVDHALMLHGVPRTYRGLMGYFATHDLEGIVFHHRDGRMAKVKTTDFYHLSRP